MSLGSFAKNGQGGSDLVCPSWLQDSRQEHGDGL